MGDAALVGKKIGAVSARIREMSNASGYGHFISDAVCEQWAANLVNTVDDVEAAAAGPLASDAGLEQIGTGTATPIADSTG